MHKQVILIMESAQYPFGEFSDQAKLPSKLSTRTLVKKIFETRSLQKRNTLVDKINTIKSMDCSHLIRIETVLEEENNTHVLYQYVPFKALNKLESIASSAARTEMVFEMKQKMLGLGEKLAEFKVLLDDWDFHSLGVDAYNNCKFYLDLNKVELEQISGKSNHNFNGNSKGQYNSSQAELVKAIRKIHTEKINLMFKPFIGDPAKEEKTARNQKNSHPPIEHVNFEQNLISKLKNNANIPQKNVFIHKTPQSNLRNGKNPTNLTNSIGNVDTPSSTHLRRSKQNWKEIEHDEEILKDFINVLDDEPEEEQAPSKKDLSPPHEEDEVDEKGREEEQEYGQGQGLGQGKQQESQIEYIEFKNENKREEKRPPQIEMFRKNNGNVGSKFATNYNFTMEEVERNSIQKFSGEPQLESEEYSEEEVVWEDSKGEEMGNEEQEVIWDEGNENGYGGNDGNNENEECSNSNDNEDDDILNRVSFVIKRSKDVMEVFKRITKA